MKKHFGIKLLLTGAVISALSFLSCEIGLGASVDTEAPSITVTYPPESSVIRSSFTVAGTVTDDQGIEKVTVKVENTDTGVNYGTYTADVKENVWSLTLNKSGSYNGFEYPDGRYIVSVSATDTSGRLSGTASRSFDIDNTAPVLIISKPLAVGSETPSTFGKTIKIAGDISEDHTTESLIMHVREYDSTTKVLGEQRDISVSDFTTMSSDTPLVVARYYTQKEIDEETNETLKATMVTLRNKYLAIYGSGSIDEKTDAATGELNGKYSSAGDKTFYASVQLTDNARIYQNPGDSGSGSGNTTSLYYINSSSFYDSLMTENTYSLTATKLKNIINGTDSSYSAEQKNTITGMLSSSENAFYVSSNGVSSNSNVFVVNPENNPVSFVSGYEYLNKNNSRADKTNGYRELTSGSTINLTVEAGKDGTSINPEKVQVIVYKMDNYLDTDTSSKTGAKVKILVNNPSDSTTAWTGDINTSLGKAIKIGEDASFFETGKFFRIVVKGTDEEDVDITDKCSDGYGFQVTATTEPPKLTVLNSQDVYYNETQLEAGITVEFELETASGVTLINNTETYANDLASHIYIRAESSDITDGVQVTSASSETWTAETDGADGNRKVNVKITKPVSANVSGNTYKFAVTIGGDADSVPLTKGKYKYKFEAGVTDANGKSGSGSLTFYLDNQEPTINLSLSPSVSAGEETKINDTVTISGTASDNYGLDNVKYWVYTVGDESSLTAENLVKGGTTGITVASASEPEFTIDTTSVVYDPFTLTADGKTYNKKLKIKAVAQDLTGHTTEAILTDYVIDQTTDKPVVNGNNFDTSIADKTGVSADAGNVFDKTGKLIGSVTDDDGLSLAELKIYKEDKTTLVSTKTLPTENGKTFNDVAVPDTPGFYYVEITAKDTAYASASSAARCSDSGKTGGTGLAEVQANRMVQKGFWIAVDNKAPELKGEDFELTSVNYVKDNTVTITGKVKDDWKLADSDGMKLLVKAGSDTDYKAVDYASVSVAAAADSTGDYAGYYTWTGTINFTGKAQGNYGIKVIATDAAKRTKEITAVLCRDFTGPAFGTGVLPGKTGYSETTVEPYIVESLSKTSPVYYNTTTLSVKGSVSDAATGNSGVSKVEYTIDGGTSWTTLSGTSTFEGTIVGLKNGDTILIQAADKAGNITQKSLGTVQIDIVNPSGSLTGTILADSISAATVFDTASGTIETNAVNTIFVQGSMSDASSTSCASGIASIQFHYGSSSFASTDEKATLNAEAGTWTYKLNNSLISSAFSAGGSGNLWARITDKAGNKVDIPMQLIIYDGQYPESKIDSIKYWNTETSVTKANGKITIKGSSSDNQTLKSVKLEYIKKSVYDAASDKTKAVWSQYGSTETVNLYNWEFTVDTTTLTDTTDYYFRASATDSAGNTGNSKAAVSASAYDSAKYKTITVSQDSDRPEITFTTIDLSSMTASDHAWLKKTNTIYYNVSDDDGAVEVKYRNGYEWVYGTTKYYTASETPAVNDQLYLDSGCVTAADWKVASFTAAAGADAAKIKISDTNDTNSYALSAFVSPSLDGSIEVNDGSYILLFQITDKQASGFASTDRITFTSGVKGTTYNTDKDNGPKLKDSSNNTYADDTRLYLNVDKSAPAVQNKTYAVWDSSLATPAYGTAVTTVGTLKFGGVHFKFKITVEAKDDNGVQKVEVKKSGTTVKTVTDSDSSKKDAAWHSWEISDIDISALTSGTYEYSLVITDYAGIEKTDTFNITVDNTPATLNVDSHTEGEQVGLAFILKGTVDDSDTGTTVKFYVDKDSSVIAAGDAKWSATSVTSLVQPVASWRINVDGKTNANDGETHIKTHKQLFVENYGDAASSGTTYGILLNSSGTIVTKSSSTDTTGTTERYTTIKPLYFHFLVTDSAGNTSTKTFRLNIDPQGDIPTVTMTYPTVGTETTSAGVTTKTYGWYCASAPEVDRWMYTDTAGDSLTSTKTFKASDGINYTYTYRGAKTTLSGFIRAMGNAEAKGDATIVGVYMQIDPAYNPVNGFNASAWTGTSLSTVKANIKCPDNTTLSSHLTDTNNIEYIYTKYNAAQSLDSDKKAESSTSNNLYAIYIGSDPSWGYTINKGELEGLNGATNTIAVRLYAVDSTGKLTNVDPMNDLIITIDSEAPKMGSHKAFYLYQYAWKNAATSAVIYTDRGPASLSLGSLANENIISVYSDSGCSTTALGTGTYTETTSSSVTTRKITYGGIDYVPQFRSVEYEDNMWLKGEWWINGSIEDDSDVSLIKETNSNFTIVSQVSSGSPSYGSGKANGQYVVWSDTTTKGFIINYRAGSNDTNSYGELTYSISATDLKENASDEKTAVKIFSINYDNKAPEVDTSGTFFDMDTTARNDNGYYTVGTAAYESGTQSGFARAVVYFTKASTTPSSGSAITNAIFDTYIKKSADGNAQAYSSLHCEDNLYWITGTISSYTNKTITLTAAAGKNIHKGGLVKLAGAYYIITDVSGNQVTLDDTPAEDLEGYEIYFALGHVIDHEGQEGKGSGTVTADEYYGYYSTLASDNDYDHMIEKVSTSGNRTIWSGDINTLNMPDGPVTLHYVVFDNAGNVKENTLEVVVGNNAPRLASVRIWSDYNGNGTEDSAESNTYYYAEVPRQLTAGAAKVSKSLDLTSTLVVCNADANNNKNAPIAGTSGSGTAFMTVKDSVTLVPEIVGGNGSMYYSYMAGTAAQFKEAYSSTANEYDYDTFAAETGMISGVNYGRNTTSFGTGHEDYIDSTADTSGYYLTDVNGDSYISGHTGYGTSDGTEYAITYTGTQMASLGNSTSSASPTWFEFKIWDSAEGSTKWTNALSAKIQIALNVMYNDTTNPVVNVNRFFHEKAGCDTSGNPLNSLYKGSADNGHIELEGELSGIAAGTTALQTVTSTLNTLDETSPKVSGKITIRGTAYDDIRLKELYVKFPGHSKIGSALTKAATYTVDSTTKTVSWVSASADTEANMTANGWTFTATDRYNKAEGHLVDWELNIDTSFISTRAAKGVAFQFQAKDWRGSLTSATTDSLSNTDVDKYNRPGYTMDVVPYITKVATSLTALNTSNPSVYGRTALGHYPVYKATTGFDSGAKVNENNETVKVYGFNLEKDTSHTAPDFDDDGSYITITPVKGQYTAVTNKIPSLNNINNNDAKGIKKDGTAVSVTLSQSNYGTYAYNRQPNGANNNLLTDDVEFDVWDVNRKAARAENNMVLDASMKINPANGLIGFAFNNGDYYWSMPATDTSYQKYYQCNDFTRVSSFNYDSEGNTYGAVLGGGSEPTYGDAYRLYTSKWNGGYIDIESSMQKGKKGESDPSTYYLDKDRFVSASYATYTYTPEDSSTTSTNVYMAYFDRTNGEIRYKAGTIGSSAGTFGTFYTGKGATGGAAVYTNETCQIVADDEGNALGYGGEYVSIGVTSDNVVVMVWYDSKNHSLKYAYNRNGATGTDPSNSPATNTGVNSTGWSSAYTLRSNAGKFCQLVVANDNSIHIAAYDSKNCDLVYINMSSYKDTGTTKVAVVDAYQTTGKEITIDVAQSGDYQIPYIGYWASYPKRARFAYLAHPETFYDGDGTAVNGYTGKNGAESNKFTGVWDVSVVPTCSTIYLDDNTLWRISVGVWKYNGTAADNGKLAYSTTGTNRGKSNGTNSYTSSTAAATTGNCYGNGTNNAVIGYTINDPAGDSAVTTFETAQKE